MEYRQLGKTGLKLSELSFGSWVTFGTQLDLERAKECMRIAYEQGVNFFDNAEAYGDGQAEIIMGKILREFPRDELVISTKIFWGGQKPNQTGLSRKHILEGTRNSLKRFELDYVDLIFCHRPDPETPIEETVLAMDYVVRQGYAFYWGTSEWSAAQIEEAHQAANSLGCIHPAMEQPQYNLLVRDKVEIEFQPLYKKCGMGTTIWSPLASGLLSGKYVKGIPEGSRLANIEWLRNLMREHKMLSEETIGKIQKLESIAKRIGCTLPQLSIAWCLKNPNVSTVITGASRKEQLLENLKASEIKDLLTDKVLAEVKEAI
jgi:voltage-dependent potassium channel beta subunit